MCVCGEREGAQYTVRKEYAVLKPLSYVVRRPQHFHFKGDFSTRNTTVVTTGQITNFFSLRTAIKGCTQYVGLKKKYSVRNGERRFHPQLCTNVGYAHTLDQDQGRRYIAMLWPSQFSSVGCTEVTSFLAFQCG